MRACLVRLEREAKLDSAGISLALSRLASDWQASGYSASRSALLVARAPRDQLSMFVFSLMLVISPLMKPNPRIALPP